MSRRPCCLHTLLALLLALPLAGAARPARGQAAAPVVEPGASVKIEGAVAFLEGPAWRADGNLLFSDVENNRIMRRDPTGVLHVFRTPSGRANGLFVDGEQRLVMCEGGREGGNRRVTRLERNGVLTVLADNYQGSRFNSPNDLTIDGQGRIYFTDPRYGDRGDMQLLDAEGRAVEGVYRIDPNGQVTRILTHEVQRPNGIAVSPDGRLLYVVDNNNGTPDGNRKVWQFALDAQGDVVAGGQKLVYDFGRGRGGDGMTLDAAGRLYVTAGLNIHNPPLEDGSIRAGVYVISPEGQLIDFIPVLEDMVTNCELGGDDGRTLFITAGHTLFSVRVTTPAAR